MSAPSPRRAAALILAGATVLVAYLAAVPALLPDGFALDVGSLTRPHDGLLRFYMIYGVLGLVAAGLMAKGLAALPVRLHAAAANLLDRGSDRAWMAGAAAIAVALSLVVRTLVLHGAPLTDDESAYRFSAELLASGRLWVESPPMKLFFDRTFMVNDGRLYSQYFLGWPALLAPFAALGVPGLANALLHGATMPALFRAMRRGGGSRVARFGVALALTSPFLTLGAATELSHTACLCLLAWTAVAAMRSRDQDAPLAVDLAVGLLFAAAFFVRPTSALGAGAPFLAWWLWGVARDGRPVTPRLLAFGLPAAALAGLFLAVNVGQQGSPLEVAYHRRLAYAGENLQRFVPGPDEPLSVANYRFDSLRDVVALHTAALLRLNFAVLGWPTSLLLAFASGRSAVARLFQASVACFFLVHLGISDAGVDAFGPVHFAETSLGWLVLTPLGVAAMACKGTDPAERALPWSLAVAMVVVAAVGFTPARVWTAALQAEDVLRAPRAAADLPTPAVVFSVPRFAPPCASNAAVYYRPNNDPDLSRPVLWVNHLSVERDRQLMAHLFPARRGYVLTWADAGCRAVLRPLEALTDAQAPPSYPESMLTDGAADP
jgi:hypothetical protein